MVKKKKTIKYTQAINDTVKLPNKQGNGVLKYSVSVDSEDRIVRYSLAYINPRLCAVDNFRVIGYDNCHGYHHRHYMGKEENIEFTSYEDIENQFEIAWRKLHEKAKKHS
jgi:hypothetical protein